MQKMMCTLLFSSLQMSKRGTSASRPGVKSLKEQKAQAEAMVAAAEAAREEDLSDEPIQEVSPIVNNRILTRIIIFSGVPVATAFALFPVFYYLKVTSPRTIQHRTLALNLVLKSTFPSTTFQGVPCEVLSPNW